MTNEERDLLDWLLLPDAVVSPEIRTEPLEVLWHAYRRNDRSFPSPDRLEAIRAAVAYNKNPPDRDHRA